MNLFNRKVRKASEQLTIPSISSMSPMRSRKDKDSKCFYCKGDINRYGPYYQESNGINLYHTKCLTCHQCKQDCSSEFYFTFKKINKHYLPTIYCKKDMNETCQHCGGSIEQGGLVTFLGYKYHEDHFRCTVCNVLLSHAEQAFELKKNLYCLKHFVAEYKNERLNQRAFLENREIAKIKNKKSNRHKDDEEDDDEEDDEEEEVGDEDIDFDVNNLDVRDFRNNDYSTKYCGGCSTMLLAGTNINEMRFRNSKKHEYWHLDCFLLFQRYKVILSPKFVDPRRYIMFNENASSINLNADLRNISKWLNLYYEKVEQKFTEISKSISSNDKAALYKGFNGLVLQTQALFNALQDIEFIIEDHYTKMRYFQYTDAKGSHLEKLNFTRYRTLKDKHIKIFSCFNNLLKRGVSHYDINVFTTSMLKNIDHVIAFILHKILIYNYLTKEKQLLSIFLTKINDNSTINDDEYDFDDSFDEYLSDKSIDAAASVAAADGSLSRGNSTSSSSTPVTTNLTTNDTTRIGKAESAITTTTDIITNNANNAADTTTTNMTLYPELKCSKCNQDIKLEPYVIQIYNDDSPRVYRFHMTCTTPADMNDSANVPVIPNAYGPTAGDLLFEPSEYAHIEYVSVFDQTFDSIRRLLKRWLAKEQQSQKQKQQRGFKVRSEDQIKQRRDDLSEQFHEQQSLL